MFSYQEILDTIEADFNVLPVKGSAHDTAKHFMIPGHEGSFSVISTMTAPFCSTCNRMRLTADGKLKNCLFSKDETDLLTPLRNGENIIKSIQECIGNKKKELGGQLVGNFEKLNAESIENRSMITIGG